MTQRVLTDLISALIDQWDDWPENERASRPGLAFWLAEQLLTEGIVGD